MARILIIDDDDSLLNMMNLMLQRAGHEPILAENGKKGINTAKREKPDLAIVGVNDIDDAAVESVIMAEYVLLPLLVVDRNRVLLDLGDFHRSSLQLVFFDDE